MQLAAVYHRPDSEMAYLVTKDKFQIRLRTKANDVKKVEVLYGDPYGSKVNEKDEQAWEYATKCLTKRYQTTLYDYWITEVESVTNRLQYVFKIEDLTGETYFYDDRAIDVFMPDSLENMSAFRMPYFHEVDRVKVPEWVKNTVWYQIFPERFCNGDETNDARDVEAWGNLPTTTNFFGGDLQGIIDKLDYLKDLGIGGLYLCPIFKAPSNHKYDTIDYFEIDPMFGDKETFKKLVDEAHKRGLKIMLDAVFNHMGDHSMQWRDVKLHGEQSRFADWFHIKEFPVSYDATSNYEYARNISYEVFANTPHMPKLNTANAQVKEYLLEIASYWIKQFDIDAWRLDVANEIDHHFWQDFSARVHSLKKDFYVLGEVWHSSQSWLNGTEFDAVMNYPLTESLLSGIVRRQISLVQMRDRIYQHLMLYRDQTNQVMFNALDTHDTTRLLTLCHDDKKLLKLVLAVLFMQIGSPCLYYGTEVGLSGGPDPLCRKCMPWDDQQDADLLAFCKQLVTFKNQHVKLLSYGEFTIEIINDTSFRLVRRYVDDTLVGTFNIETNDFEISLNEQLVVL